MNNLKTAKDVMTHFLRETAQGRVFTAQEWLQAAGMLSVLQGEEQAKLIDSLSKLNLTKVQMVEKYGTASKAKIYIESTPEWAECEKQKAFISQIVEFIRVAKKQADASNQF